MNYYELLYIVPARYTDLEVEGVNERVRSLLEGQGATVNKTDNLGKLRFAYPVAGTSYGTYLRMVFTVEPPKLKDIETALRLFGELARVTVTKTTERALARTYNLTAYQEPALQGPREREMRPRTVRIPAPRPAPPAAKPITEEELEKQIDKILEEKIL